MTVAADRSDRVVRRLSIEGKVQGVWYRNWAIETATALGLDGWVRNCADGTVEALAAGRPDAVGRFVFLCHAGPPAARVTRISLELAEDPGPGGFRKEETV